MPNGPLLDLPLREWYYDALSKAQTRNAGLLGGSVQLGDGTTVGTFPTQIGGMQSGMSLNGSQYLQHLSALANGTYTVAMMLKRTVGTRYLLDSRASAGVGWLLDTGGVLSSSSGTIYVDGQATTACPLGVHSVLASGITLSAPAKTVLFADNALANIWPGTAYHVAIYPGTLTATQARSYHERQMSLLSMR